MVAGSDYKQHKNFLLTIQQINWLEKTSYQQKISEAEIIRNLINKEIQKRDTNE